MGITNSEISDLKLGDDGVSYMTLGDQQVWPVEGSYLEFDVPDPNNDLSVHKRGNAIRFSALFDNWRAGFIVAVSTEVGDQILGTDAATPEEDSVIKSIPEKPFNVTLDGKTSIFVGTDRPIREGSLQMTGYPDRFDGSIWFKTNEYNNDDSFTGIKRWSGNNAAWLDLNDVGTNPIYTITGDIALVWKDLASTTSGELSGLYGQGIAYISGGEMNDYLNQELQFIDIGSNMEAKEGNTGIDWDVDDWVFSNNTLESDIGERSANSFIKKSLLSAGWGNNPGTSDSVKVWYGNTKPSSGIHRHDGEGYSLYDFYYDTNTQKLFRLTNWEPQTFPIFSHTYDGLYDSTLLIDFAGNSIPTSYRSNAYWLSRFLKNSSGSWILPKPTSLTEWNNLNYYGQSIAARCLDDRSINFTWTEIDDIDTVDTFAQGISSINPTSAPEEPVTKTSYKLFFDVPVASFMNPGQKKTYIGRNQYRTWPGKSTTPIDDIMVNISRVGTVPYNFQSGNNLIRYNYSSLARITPEAMDEVIELDSLTQYQFESIKTIKIRNNRLFYDGVYDPDYGIGLPGGRPGGYPKEDRDFPIAWPVGNGAPWGIKSPVGSTQKLYRSIAYGSPDYTLIRTYVPNNNQVQILTYYDPNTRVKGTSKYQISTNADGLLTGPLWNPGTMPMTDMGHFKPVYNTGTFYQYGTSRQDSVDSAAVIESDLAYKEFGKYWADPFTEQYDAVQTRRMANWFPLGGESGGSGGTGKLDSDLYAVNYGIPYRIWEGTTYVPDDGGAINANGYKPMEFFWRGDEEKDDIEISTDIASNGCRKITATIPLPQSSNQTRGWIGHKVGDTVLRAGRYNNTDLAYGRLYIYYINRSSNSVTVTATLQGPGNQIITKTLNISGNTSYKYRRPQIEFTGLTVGSYTYSVSDNLSPSNEVTVSNISVNSGGTITNNISKWYARSVTKLGSLQLTKILPLPPTLGAPDISVRVIPIDLERITRLLPEFDDYYSDSDRGPIMYFYDHDFWYTTDPYSNGYRRPFFSFMPYKQAATFTPNSEVLLVFFPFSKQELEQGHFDSDVPRDLRGFEQWRFQYRGSSYSTNNDPGTYASRRYVPPEERITTVASGYLHPEMKIASDAITTSVLYDTAEKPFITNFSSETISETNYEPEVAPDANNEIYGSIVCDYNDGWGTGLPRRRRSWADSSYLYPYYNNYSVKPYYSTYKGAHHFNRSLSIPNYTHNIDVPMDALWPTALVLTTDSSGRINGVKHNGTQPLDSNNNPADFTGALMFDYAARAEWTEDPWFTVCQSLSAGQPTSKGDTIFDHKFNNELYRPVGGINKELSVVSEQVIDIKQATPYYSGNRYRSLYADKMQLANAYIFDGAPSSNYGYDLQSILNNQEFPSTAHRCAFISNGMVSAFGRRLDDYPEEEVLNMGVPDTLVGIEFEDFTSGRYPSVLDKDSTNPASGWVNNFYFGGASFTSFLAYSNGNDKPVQQFSSNRPIAENGDTRYYTPPYGYYSATTRMGWATQTGIKNIKCKNLSKLLFIKDAGSTDVLQFPLPSTYKVATDGWKEACKGVLNQLKEGSQITVEGCSNFQYAIPGSAVLFSKTGITTVDTNVDFG